MEHIRGQAAEGHSGAVWCRPEGCKHGPDEIVVCAQADGDTPPADCVLQLRLRAGAVEDVGILEPRVGDAIDGSRKVDRARIRGVEPKFYIFDEAESVRYHEDYDFGVQTNVFEHAGLTDADIDDEYGDDYREVAAADYEQYLADKEADLISGDQSDEPAEVQRVYQDVMETGQLTRKQLSSIVGYELTDRQWEWAKSIARGGN